MRRTQYLLLAGLLIAATSSFASNTAPVEHARTDRQVAASNAGPVTRAQVQAELVEARRHGLLNANPNQYPSEYIEHAQRHSQMLARENVKVHEKAVID